MNRTMPDTGNHGERGPPERRDAGRPHTVTAIPAPMFPHYEAPAGVPGGTLLDVEAAEAADILSHLRSLGIDLNELADRLQVDRAQATWHFVDNVPNRVHVRRQRS